VEEQRKLSHALHVLEIKDAESSQQSRRLEEEIELGQSQQAQIKLRGSEVDKVLKEVEGALVNAVSACSELEHQVDVRRKALEHHESKLNEKRNVLKKHEGERHQVSLLAAQFDSTRQNLEKELLERHKLSVDEARKEHGVTQPIEAVERQIKQLKQAVDGAGDINMTSIEECEKHKTRYQFLNQQIDDLAGSREELIAIIADLDGESRKIFHETFQQIRTNFRKNFEVLFNGGEADLHFTESADILEAGIEIIARPPGKQMRSINLLSGGEKCLTAMALLFAVFEVKPSPFCILDEIDAPLDDSNVERFVNIVRRYCETCQFIIITHNKQTMAIADVICGVSMEERGVSKLISLEFSKNATVEMAML
jgi:chromosome segregation protein